MLKYNPRKQPQPGLSRTRLVSFARRKVVAVLITVLIVALAYVLWRGVDVLLQAFAGILFAIFLYALADWTSKYTRLSHAWSLTAVVIVLFLVVGGIGWLLASHLAAQINELSEKLPQSLTEVQNYLSQSEWGQFVLQHVPQVASSFTELGPLTRLTVTGVGNFLVTVIVIFFVGLFGAAEPDVYKEGLFHLIPPAHRLRAREAVDALALNLRWWLLGQVFLMIVIGVTTAVGLWLIGVRLALTLGLIAGLLEIVPYLGPMASAVPALLMALLAGRSQVLETGGLYLFLHILEGYVLLPLVQRRAVLMPPALTLIMQVLLGELLGLMGMFVAAPLTVAVVVLAKMLYVEDTLGDENVDVPGEPGNEDKPAVKD